jgi:hypothetical protein
MTVGSLLKRTAQWVLYVVASMVLLSVGLRIYSAWQIPKAKWLLERVSHLRPGQPINEDVIRIMRARGFERLDPCTAEKCSYSTYEGGWSKDFSYQPRNATRWFVEHGGLYLGVRPWNIRVVITIKNGSIQEIRSGLWVYSRPFDIGGGINGVPRMRVPNEASPDIRVWQYPRYRDLLPQVDITPLTPDDLVAEVFAAKFSCIWGIRICRSGYDFFPYWRDLSSAINKAEETQEVNADPCPVSRMYLRVRDVDQVALGTVVYLDPVEVHLRIDQILRNESQFPEKLRKVLDPGKIDPRVFPEGVTIGTKLIITSGFRCNALPANKENLDALADSLMRYPSEGRDPREFYSSYFGPEIITVPSPPLPVVLRSE